MVQKQTLTILGVVEDGDFYDLEFYKCHGATLARDFFQTKPQVGDKITLETWGGVGSCITAIRHNGKRTILDSRAYGRA